MRSILEANPVQHLPILVDEEEAARLLGIGQSTLADLRHKGAGPRCKMIGRTVRYSVEALKEWASK